MLKSKKLPVETTNLFPTKKDVLSLFIVGTSLLMFSCSTIPENWEQTNANLVVMIAEETGSYLSEVVTEEGARARVCILSTGAVGVATYKSAILRDHDVSSSILIAINAMTKFSKEQFPDIVEGRSFVDLLREELSPSTLVSEAELYTGFLLRLLEDPASFGRSLSDQGIEKVGRFRLEDIE